MFHTLAILMNLISIKHNQFPFLIHLKMNVSNVFCCNSHNVVTLLQHPLFFFLLAYNKVAYLYFFWLNIYALSGCTTNTLSNVSKHMYEVQSSNLNGSFEVPHPHRDVNLMRVEPNKEIKECGFNTSLNSCEELNFWVAYSRWLLVTGFRNEQRFNTFFGCWIRGLYLFSKERYKVNCFLNLRCKRFCALNSFFFFFSCYKPSFSQVIRWLN